MFGHQSYGAVPPGGVRPPISSDQVDVPDALERTDDQAIEQEVDWVEGVDDQSIAWHFWQGTLCERVP
jgi:hypothetical protein